jgi:hypothetical protein
MEPTCKLQVSGNHLMCIEHWKVIPPRIQAAVQERLFGWKSIEEAEIYLLNYIHSAATRRLA